MLDPCKPPKTRAPDPNSCLRAELVFLGRSRVSKPNSRPRGQLVHSIPPHHGTATPTGMRRTGPTLRHLRRRFVPSDQRFAPSGDASRRYPTTVAGTAEASLPSDEPPSEPTNRQIHRRGPRAVHATLNGCRLLRPCLAGPTTARTVDDRVLLGLVGDQGDAHHVLVVALEGAAHQHHALP